MTIHPKGDSTTTVRRLNRREFGRTICTATTAGTVGAAVSRLAVPLFAQGGVPSRAGSAEFAQPATLRPGAQLDSRFRVSFAATVSNGFRHDRLLHRAQRTQSRGHREHAAFSVRALRGYRAHRRRPGGGLDRGATAFAQCDGQRQEQADARFTRIRADDLISSNI
jgi:hypothetical protein